MERLKSMKNTLMGCVEGQLAHLDCVDAQELGEAVDMIKDLEEAMYYHTIRESMEENSKDERKMDKQYGRMYYGGDKMYYHEPMRYNDSTAYYHETRPFPEMRDTREGTSPMSRRMYMESKEMHKDKTTQMKELEKYMQELTKDIMEMIADASVEEKQILQQRISTLANKIQ